MLPHTTFLPSFFKKEYYLCMIIVDFFFFFLKKACFTQAYLNLLGNIPRSDVAGSKVVI